MLCKHQDNCEREMMVLGRRSKGIIASGLAGTMGKLGTVGLPAAVFSPWMNISGSILANFWRKRAVDK